MAIQNPRLYAVVSHQPAAAPAHKRQAADIRQEKADEFQAKKAIDRTNAVLDRLEARAAAYAKQIACLQRRKRLAEARFERVEDEVIKRMQAALLTKADGFHVQFSTRVAPPSLVVDDEAAIPSEYIREKYVSEPMKVEIKAALALGVEIPGVRLTRKISLLRK